MIRNLVLGSSLLALGAFAGDECSVSNEEKTDCGYSGIDETQCVAKGCCWQPVTTSSTTSTPWCYYQAGAGSCFVLQQDLKEPFSSSEVETMKGYFLANINIESKGGVVAAPDYDTPGGSYYYHWMRDGALTMRTYQEITTNFTTMEGTMKTFVDWVLHTQSESDPNGQDVRTEPKFELPNGEVFTGAWCRPQNDGPGLQATALMMFADTLIANGETDYVRKYLWTGDANVYQGGAIKRDLDYIVSGYSSDTCDLWEEIRSTNFFWNRFTMKKAMGLGADFASRMGDSSSSSNYKSTEQRINSTLYSDHWSGYVYESTSRTKVRPPFLSLSLSISFPYHSPSHSHPPQDSAVIVGFNAAFDENDGMYAPNSYEVAATVSSYNTLFCNEYKVILPFSLPSYLISPPLSLSDQHRRHLCWLPRHPLRSLRWRHLRRRQPLGLEYRCSGSAPLRMTSLSPQCALCFASFCLREALSILSTTASLAPLPCLNGRRL
jgi:glucoamylase